MKKLVFIRAFGVTFFVFLLMWFLSFASNLKVMDAFDPFAQALGQVELTDYVFSELREDPKMDTNIVIVNLAPTRAQIAQQIRMISQERPKVIGIDSFFNCEGGLTDSVNCPNAYDTLSNLILANAIEEAGNVVLVSRLLQSKSMQEKNLVDVYDSIEYSDPVFCEHATHAFANLVTGATYQEDVKICKSVIPKMEVNGEQKVAFSVAVASMFDSTKANGFLARDNYEEVINYRGSSEILDIKIEAHRQEASTANFRLAFYALDWPDLFHGRYVDGLFKDKVVIMGFMGDYPGDPAWSDKFFTPLNKRIAGRANPDMFGVVVHANIVSMILAENYVNKLADWLLFVLAVMICFGTVVAFHWTDERFPYWFDALSVFIQLFEILLLSATTIYAFDLYNLKLDLTLATIAAALVGPCFDVFKGFENTWFKRLTKAPNRV